MSTKVDEKKVFLIASHSQERVDFYLSVINKFFANSTVFFAQDSQDCTFKMTNYPPHVVILDNDLPKIGGLAMTQEITGNPLFNDTSIILVAEIPDREHFIDEVVTGKLQILSESLSEDKLNRFIAKALNYVGFRDKESYKLKYLAPKELLFKEGEAVDSVYIVKKGELQAFKEDSGSEVVLGQILVGEFVGEMAHINNAPRSATVRAISNCELIEIPHGTLDTILFSKPAWSKALVATLSKRLARTNKTISSS